MTDFRMYLQGNEDGYVELICTARECMAPGQVTTYNPDGRYYQDVGSLPAYPGCADVMKAWHAHLTAAHPLAQEDQ